MMTSYDDKGVVITGAANGIGRELAERLGRAGARLALADIDEERLRPLAEELRGEGVDVVDTVLDVAQPDGLAALAQRLGEEWDRVDYVFSNAGVISVGCIWQEPVSDWQWLLGTNTMGAVHTMRAFIPLMVDQGPDAEGASSHFVTTASIASLLTVENSPAYVASKFAALSATEVLELQLQDAGAPVMAHAVCPAIVRTDLLDCARHRHPGSFDPGDPYYASPDFRRRAQGAAQEMATVGMPVEQAVTTILDEVEKGTFYILTHPQYNPAVLGRVQGIVNGARPTKVVR
ncbi:MAG: SDR family NAD(P)-dependent oxidoreductase [Cutibacterium avidum]|nr:SDR family NAD(P)-dependent oxidoreductase [Cutibacterium avidum]